MTNENHYNCVLSPILFQLPISSTKELSQIAVKSIIKKLVFGLERQLYVSGLRTLTFPNFIGLGPGQCGTTWLARHLDSHPDVNISPKKETHFFDRHLNAVSLREYASYFTAGSGISGEITPGYSILDCQRIALMKKLLPDVRLFITLRNPIDRSWSAARRLMPKLGVKIDSIDEQELLEYLRLEWAYRPPNGARLSGAYEPGLLEGHYCQTLDNWLSVFPSEQLLVIFFDDILTQPAEVLRRVCVHIGVNPDYEWDSSALLPAVNRNDPHPLPDHLRRFLETLYRPEIQALARRLGGPAGDWLASLEDAPLVHGDSTTSD